MKKIIFYFTLVVGFSAAYAQVVIDDSGTETTPHESAVLDLISPDKALMLTRLAAEPTNPADGLVYYDTTLNCYRAWSVDQWFPLAGDCVAAPIARCENPVQEVRFNFHQADGNEASAAAVETDEHVSAVLTRGPGTLTGATHPNGFFGTDNAGADLGDALANNDYFELTINIAPGYVLDVNGLEFTWYHTHTNQQHGAHHMAIRSSADGFVNNLWSTNGTALDGPGSGNHIVDVNETLTTPLVAVSGTLVLRFYVWGADEVQGQTVTPMAAGFYTGGDQAETGLGINGCVYTN